MLIQEELLPSLLDFKKAVHVVSVTNLVGEKEEL